MPAARRVLAVLIAVALAVLPVSAGLAQMHAAAAEMSIGDSGGGACCDDAGHECAADACALKCYNAPAISTEEAPLAEPLLEPASGTRVAAMSPFSQRPDPPPPRF